MASKIDLDMVKLIEKDPTGKVLFNKIREVYLNEVGETIRTTIEEETDFKSLEDWEKDADRDNRWLAKAISSAIYSTKAVANSTDIGNMVMDTGKFRTEFSRATEAKIKYIAGEFGDKGIIETEIELKAGGTPNAEKIYEILHVAFRGGEIQKETEGSEGDETLIFNARKGYNQSIIDAASKDLQEYFFEQHSEDIEKRLTEELTKELNKFKK